MTLPSARLRTTPTDGAISPVLVTAARWLRVLVTGVDSFLALFLTAVPSASTASEEVG